MLREQMDSNQALRVALKEEQQARRLLVDALEGGRLEKDAALRDRDAALHRVVCLVGFRFPSPMLDRPLKELRIWRLRPELCAACTLMCPLQPKREAKLLRKQVGVNNEPCCMPAGGTFG